MFRKASGPKHRSVQLHSAREVHCGLRMLTTMPKGLGKPRARGTVRRVDGNRASPMQHGLLLGEVGFSAQPVQTAIS